MAIKTTYISLVLNIGAFLISQKNSINIKRNKNKKMKIPINNPQKIQEYFKI